MRRNSFSSDEKESPITTAARRSKTKSLENLHEAAKKKEEILNKNSPKEKSEPTKDTGQKSQPMEAKVVVKQSGEKVDKKKTFNYESVIEITLPSQQQMPLTIPIPDISKDMCEEKVEEPIRPIICTPKSSKITSHNNNNSDRKISPSSGGNESFVSNKQNPMEWDDFIPVSYILLLC